MTIPIIYCCLKKLLSSYLSFLSNFLLTFQQFNLILKNCCLYLPIVPKLLILCSYRLMLNVFVFYFIYCYLGLVCSLVFNSESIFLSLFISKDFWVLSQIRSFLSPNSFQFFYSASFQIELFLVSFFQIETPCAITGLTI